MLNQSVIKQSGQLWKLGLAVFALLFGSFAPLFTQLGVSWTAGTVVAIVGYVYGMVAISCAACGSRWLWEAAKDAGYYGPIFKQSECPMCQHEYNAS